VLYWAAIVLCCAVILCCVVLCCVVLCTDHSHKSTHESMSYNLRGFELIILFIMPRAVVLYTMSCAACHYTALNIINDVLDYTYYNLYYCNIFYKELQ
jgi:hypothetical protein